MLREYDMLCEKKCFILYGNLEIIRKIGKLKPVFRMINANGKEEETISEIINGSVYYEEIEGLSDTVICIFNGMVKDEIFALMKNFKENYSVEWIFATTTETNMNWKMGDLILELKMEHKEMHGK